MVGVVLGVPLVASAEATAVSTFHSIGLTWTIANGSEDIAGHVRYRRVGTCAWKPALDLWFDARAAGSSPSAQQYRGSIVGLRPGTPYEVNLSLETGVSEKLVARTWDEGFTVGRTVQIGGVRNQMLVIAPSDSGSRDGYVLYTAAPGGSAIDVAGQWDHNILVNASYVIIRGFQLRGARQSAIFLGANAHDVVIEENDISGFGRLHPVDGDGGQGWGLPFDAAVHCNHYANVERIVIQRNRMHHPRATTNSWFQPRAAYCRPDAGSHCCPPQGSSKYSWCHPQGPMGVAFIQCGGNHVIRYNSVYSDELHWFEDGIGGGENFSNGGFPLSNSDIYGNDVSFCRDDAIEAEGANLNVRVWGNQTNQAFTSVAMATTLIGPAYVFRNVSGISLAHDLDQMDLDAGIMRGQFLKLGSKLPQWGALGRVYVFHNTTRQPGSPWAIFPVGVANGISRAGGAFHNVVSRNNIFHSWRPNAYSVMEGDETGASNDFDFDLYSGRVEWVDGGRQHERGGIHGVPTYATSDGGLALAPTSAGYDVGLKLPNLNQDFSGAGPDLGAQEGGRPLLEFGVTAYRTGRPPFEEDWEADASACGGPDASMDGDAGVGGEDGHVEPAQRERGCHCASAPGLVALILLSTLSLRSRGAGRRGMRFRR